MKQLIKIQTNENGQNVVSARALYDNLGYTDSQFIRWAAKNIEQNTFAQYGTDWVRFDIKSKGKPIRDFAISIDFAKNLCMLSRTLAGEKIRRYFIEFEKKATTTTITAKINQLESEIKKIKALAAHSETNEFTIFGYSKYVNIPVYGYEAVCLGKAAAKECRAVNMRIGKIRDTRFGMVNTYPESILKKVFETFIKTPRF